MELIRAAHVSKWSFLEDGQCIVVLGACWALSKPSSSSMVKCLVLVDKAAR